MGLTKRSVEENEANGYLEEFLDEMLKRDELEGALEGIAKQAVGKGLKSLTYRQREVVDKFVQNYEEQNECPRCSNGNVTSLADLIYISENMLCPICDNDREKFMRD